MMYIFLPTSFTLQDQAIFHRRYESHISSQLMQNCNQGQMPYQT